VADVTLAPVVPGRRDRSQRAQRLGQLVQQRDNPAALVGTVAMQAAYGTRHPYGFAEIGTEASVKAISRTDMQAFWKERFVPNNARSWWPATSRCPSCARGRKGVRRVGAWLRVAAAARRAADDGGAGGHRGQAREPADTAARRRHRRGALVARLPPAAGDEHDARRACSRAAST
jgi:hypothetical protein